ncbi:hypothetical protein PRUPE_3G179700 [Prunus persica]|uniref:Uncharacterized protein n=1 Tax=Prunus persica TaxID=3760 RepID=A0A251Q1Y5_PRUPE|nr:hypothetical protein PRUPE_3G179700 [Prunus persica]
MLLLCAFTLYLSKSMPSPIPIITASQLEQALKIPSFLYILLSYIFSKHNHTSFDNFFLHIYLKHNREKINPSFN